MSFQQLLAWLHVTRLEESSWMEAFALLEEGHSDEDVLEAAETAVRLLAAVKELDGYAALAAFGSSLGRKGTTATKNGGDAPFL